MGAALGTELVLECETEAYPKPVSYWSRDNGEIVPVGKITFYLRFILMLVIENCPDFAWVGILYMVLQGT